MGKAYWSPLRYPGGKARIAPFLAELLSSQSKRSTVYAEPFAGGAGAAVRLLIDEYVDRIVLNDIDPGITAFWRATFWQTDAMVDRVETCELSLDEWHRQRAIYTAGESATELDLGFATFYLNRSNRSGIVNARPIGGLDQSGAWKIDARFNRSDLANRFRFLGRYRNRVSLHSEDGIDFVAGLLSEKERRFVYIDPPYLEKATNLYLDTLSWDDHVRLAKVLNNSNRDWVLTYDHDRRVKDDLYPGLRCIEFNLSHTAARQHVGMEYAVFSPSITLGDSLQKLRVVTA